MELNTIVPSLKFGQLRDLEPDTGAIWNPGANPPLIPSSSIQAGDLAALEVEPRQAET
jgi:hypothetical protein